MLWLYFLGRMFLNLFSPKMALNIYFLGAICGGLLYLLAHALFPDLLGNSRLVGASATPSHRAGRDFHNCQFYTASIYAAISGLKMTAVE